MISTLVQTSTPATKGIIGLPKNIPDPLTLAGSGVINPQNSPYATLHTGNTPIVPTPSSSQNTATNIPGLISPKLSGYNLAPSSSAPQQLIPPKTTSAISAPQTSQIDYTKHPDETLDAYNQRISKAQTQTAPPVPPPPVVPPPVIQSNPMVGQTPEEMAKTGANGTPTNQNIGTTAGVIPPSQDLSRSGLTAAEMSMITNGSQGVQDARKKVQDIQNLEAQDLHKNAMQAIPESDMIGRSSNLQNMYSQQLGAAQTGLSNELTSQDQQFGALNSLTGQAQPFQQPYNTQMGTFDAQGNPVVNSGANGGMAGAVQTAIDSMKNGKTYDQALASLSGYGQGGADAFAKAYQATGGNPNISNAQGSSAADLTGQKSQIKAIFNGADANFKLLIDTATKGGVNDGNVPMINSLQQNVGKGLTSSEAVINFQHTLADIRSQYAQILGGGSVTVDAQQRAAQAIPDNISLNALKSLQTQLTSEATNRIAGLDQQIKSFGSGGNNTSTQNSGTMFGRFFGK